MSLPSSVVLDDANFKLELAKFAREAVKIVFVSLIALMDEKFVNLASGGCGLFAAVSSSAGLQSSFARQQFSCI